MFPSFYFSVKESLKLFLRLFVARGLEQIDRSTLMIAVGGNDSGNGGNIIEGNVGT